MRYYSFLIEFFNHFNAPYQNFTIKLYVKYAAAQTLSSFNHVSLYALRQFSVFALSKTKN